jgi:hypothetical protein
MDLFFADAKRAPNPSFARTGSHLKVNMPRLKQQIAALRLPIVLKPDHFESHGKWAGLLDTTYDSSAESLANNNNNKKKHISQKGDKACAM